MNIVQAELKHVESIGYLFDLYRQFYHCEPDRNLANEYIQDRLRNNESVIFLAQNEQGKGQGFVQLYPSFCSVDAVKIMILYDLFVDNSARRQGVGEALMNRAKTYASEVGAARLDLLTAHSNIVGQSLYEKLGYEKTNTNFHAYSLQL